MGQVAVRQEARRSALKAQADMKAERKKQEKRLSALGIDVVVALGERDAAVERCELQSGRALAKMQAEGLSVREALQWCGPEVSRGEAARLLKLAEEVDGAGPDEAAQPDASCGRVTGSAQAAGREGAGEE